MTAEIFEISIAIVAAILLTKPVLNAMSEFQRSYTRLQIQREEDRTDLMRARLKEDLIRQQLRANARLAQTKIGTEAMAESTQAALALLDRREER